MSMLNVLAFTTDMQNRNGNLMENRWKIISYTRLKLIKTIYVAALLYPQTRFSSNLFCQSSKPYHYLFEFNLIGFVPFPCKITLAIMPSEFNRVICESNLNNLQMHRSWIISDCQFCISETGQYRLLGVNV